MLVSWNRRDGAGIPLKIFAARAPCGTSRDCIGSNPQSPSIRAASQASRIADRAGHGIKSIQASPIVRQLRRPCGGEFLGARRAALSVKQESGLEALARYRRPGNSRAPDSATIHRCFWKALGATSRNVAFFHRRRTIRRRIGFRTGWNRSHPGKADRSLSAIWLAVLCLEGREQPVPEGDEQHAAKRSPDMQRWRSRTLACSREWTRPTATADRNLRRDQRFHRRYMTKRETSCG